MEKPAGGQPDSFVSRTFVLSLPGDRLPLRSSRIHARGLSENGPPHNRYGVRLGNGHQSNAQRTQNRRNAHHPAQGWAFTRSPPETVAGRVASLALHAAVLAPLVVPVAGPNDVVAGSGVVCPVEHRAPQGGTRTIRHEHPAGDGHDDGAGFSSFVLWRFHATLLRFNRAAAGEPKPDEVAFSILTG